ncbi:MAG: ABC transporter substrate-binding protein [Patescibacteria group bacterium]
MTSKIKSFFLNLSKNLKGFIFLQLEKFSQHQKIAKQKNLDQKIIAKLSKQRLPSWRQFKRLPQTLSAQESLLIKILGGLVIICLIVLFYFNFYTKLKTVPKDGGEFTEGLIGSPLYLNPILAQSNTDADLDLTRLIFSGLLKYNENLELVPDLAEKYEISSDQKIYTFYLKKNVKWHDGENLTASDVVFTFNSILNPDFKSPLYRSFAGSNAEKIDDYTVKFTLQEPYAAFLNLLTVGIIPQHLWYDIPPINAKLAVLNQKPIGSGPYKFKSLVKEKTGMIKIYTLEKNKDYYGKVPYINKILLKFYPDYENAITALTNKEIDNLSYLPKEYYNKFSNKRDINLLDLKLSQYTAVFFNKKNNTLLEDKKIKEALSYAIDKNKIIDDVLQGQGQVLDGPILPGFLGYNADITKYGYNPQKAIELLVSDGWTLAGEIFKKKDQELKITLTTIEQTDNIKIANLLKEFWTSIGVNVEIQTIPRDKIEDDIIKPRNYQALLYGEIVGSDPDLFPFWHSSQKDTAGVNLANYANRQADVLLEEARLNSDPKVRAQKYQEFQNILIGDLPAVFLFQPTYIYPLTKKIKGVGAQNISVPADRFINIENWYLKTKKTFSQ